MLNESATPPHFLLSTLRYIKHPSLRRAIVESQVEVKPPFYKQEFHLLNSTINRVNVLLNLKEGSESHDLSNIYGTQPPLNIKFSELPELFSWKDKQQRHKWNKSLIDTFDVFNHEIRTADRPNNTYEDPYVVGGPRDVFRFFLWDMYARWRAKDLKLNDPTNMNGEMDIANAIINVLCEAAVVEAETGKEDSMALLAWLNKKKWIDQKWGFSEALVARAKKWL